MENKDVQEFYTNQIKEKYQLHEIEVEVDAHIDDEEEAYVKIDVEIKDLDEDDNESIVALMDTIRDIRQKYVTEMSIYLFINKQRIGKLPYNKKLWKQ